MQIKAKTWRQNRKRSQILNRSLILFGIMISVICLSGCESGGTGKPAIHGGNEIPVYPNQESGADKGGVQSSGAQNQTVGEGLIIEVDTKSKTCAILLLDTSETVVYTYNGTTEVFDRHEEPLAIEQLLVGEIVQYEYVNAGKRLTKLREWSEAWEYQGATNFQIDADKQVLQIGEEEYTFTDDLIVAMEQDRRVISLDKLASVDIVTLKGRDQQIDSVIVTQGHGTVRLDSTAYFEGGFVDIGADYVSVITENMVIPMPAGTYIMTVAKEDTVGSKEIQVEENEELRINLTDFQDEAVRYGSVQFQIEPVGAILKIDGKDTEYTGLVDLTYGNHSVEVRKDGYGTYTQTITVDSVLSEYDITLIEIETTTGETTQTGATTQPETTEGQDGTELTETTKKEEVTTKKEEETTTYDAQSAWYDIVSGFLEE